MSKRVLITGISGFTGKYLRDFLEDFGFSVFGTTSDPSHSSNQIIHVNLLDYECLESSLAVIRPDVVVHLAAISHVQHIDSSELYLTNVVGTKNLFQALKAIGISLSSMIIASTSHVYGESQEIMLRESEPFNPVSDYAISKVAMEYLVNSWRTHFPITIVRPFNYTGVGQEERFVIPKIISHVKRGSKSIQLGNIDISKDFSDVRDIAKLYLKLIQIDQRPDCVNFCSGKLLSLRQIIDWTAELSGYKLEVLINPNFVRRNEIVRQKGDRSVLDSYVNFQRIDFVDTLDWMLSS